MPKRRLNSAWTLPNILGRLLVYLYAVVVLVPLYFVIITAFKTGTEITLHPLALPECIMWSNVRDAFVQGSLLQAMGNSILTAVTGVLMLMLNAVVLSFCIHRLRNRKLGTLLYVIILMGLFIPKVGFVSQIMLYRQLHIYDTPRSIILGAAVGNIPFSVFIIAGFLRTVPHELEEAAELDGCNDFQLLFRIMVPIIKPALVTIGIFSFTGTWNSVTGPLLFIRSKELFTIPMALLTFNSTYSTQYELLFAGILVTGLPLVIAYLFCQKYFAQALTGSVKG